MINLEIPGMDYIKPGTMYVPRSASLVKKTVAHPPTYLYVKYSLLKPLAESAPGPGECDFTEFLRTFDKSIDKAKMS